MKLHLLGLPHTVSNEDFSHCAFTGKVVKFPSMMKHVSGYEIIHYGVEGARTESDEHVTIMSRKRQIELLGHDNSDKKRFFGEDCAIDSPLYIEYNKRLNKELRQRVALDDFVLMPFGLGHSGAVQNIPGNIVESGIGYNDLHNAQFKIFESYAWMHYHQGKAQRYGSNYEWVIPNYFDKSEWDVNHNPVKNRIVFMGRITQLKGIEVIVELAKARPDIHFILCGQGDASPWIAQTNIEYMGPISGRKRSQLLGSAEAVICPTLFTEPFGGVAIEAMFCGTPILSTTFGAFTETIQNERNGFRCHTLGDFLAAIDRAPLLNRQWIADNARLRYGYHSVAQMYDRAFQQIADLRGEGWYSRRSIFARP